MRNKFGRFIKGHKLGFKKGYTPWNKGKKLEYISWNKGKKTGIIPKTAFRKGHKVNFGKHHSKQTKIKIALAQKGSKGNNWKGGKYNTKQGYILIKKPEHPFCDNQGYVREHRLVMEKHLRRYLTPEEVVHHRGERYPINSIKNRQDNRIENLQLFANDAEHKKLHKKIK